MSRIDLEAFAHSILGMEIGVIKNMSYSELHDLYRNFLLR